jgi:AcrR family transcriptional regulator
MVASPALPAVETPAMIRTLNSCQSKVATLAVLRLAADRERRWAMFAAARPVFERSGYRNATVAELAWTSGLRPASLYHYFPSKAAFALFPLNSENGLCHAWHVHAAQLPPDPMLRLEGLLDHIGRHIGSIGLALKLAGEMADDRAVASAARTAVRQAQEDFRLLGKTLDSNVDSARADDLFQAVATMAVGQVPGLDRDPDALRRQLSDLARGWLSAVTAGATD